MGKSLIIGAALVAVCSAGSMPLTAQANVPPASAVQAMNTVAHLQDFEVFELRRYVTTNGEREHFARHFESFYPEAFEQLGAIAAGSFLERQKPTGFTWIRGFHSMEDHAIVNSAFYYGPVWKEHKSAANAMLADNDNVLLLRPLDAAHRVTILPSVDPISEPDNAHGVVVMQIFAVKQGSVDALAQRAESTFARYRSAGAREAGVLVTLDVKNNFPQLVVRSDGPFMVWLGVLRDDSALARLTPVAESGAAALNATGLLRAAPEWVVMDPTRRSRLRWLADGNHD